MKKTYPLIAFFSLLLLPFSFLYANGLCIENAEQGILLTLVSSQTTVEVNDQVAVVKTIQTFRNDLHTTALVKYGFPLSQTASATGLRWYYNGQWMSADFSPNPQDTILPGGNGGSIEQSIRDYLGANAVYLNLNQGVEEDSLITIELTYVDLLPYAFNAVSFAFPGKYLQFQNEPLILQTMDFQLHSQRTILELSSSTHPNAEIILSDHEGHLHIERHEVPANLDYAISYQLDANQLGLFHFSTFLPDSTYLCDDTGNGYFAFIVEPDPSENTEVIDKVFTLIVDRSGSMSGQKIVQARNAASFIVQNLNPGDYFNIVAFDNNITSFKPDHVPFTPTNETEALNFIAGLYAGGNTNISGAFSTAISQFQNSNSDQANIILFFTDGMATAGITSTQGILDHVANLLNTYEVNDLSIFAFGIGGDVNKQLLNELAIQNNGFSEFLENNELEAVISQFYLTVRNPVLLHTSMEFDPPIVTQTYPEHLPNLYKGQQLIVVGRYDQPGDVTVHFSGDAFGQPITYDYPLHLADTAVENLQFLPRLWSKKKIEDLYSQFLSATPNSPEATGLHETIVGLSLCYGVLSPFTSFEDNTGGGGGPVGVEEFDIPPGDDVQPLMASPNPFRESVLLRLPQGQRLTGTVWVEVYDIHGRLVYRTEIFAGDPGLDHWTWNGLNIAYYPVPAGLYTVRMGNDYQTYLTKVIKQ